MKFHTISNEIFDFSQKNRIPVVDFGITGSRCSGESKPNSDYDYIILVNNQEKDHLKEYREYYLEFFMKKSKRMHFKIFSPNMILDMAKYDGFRVEELKKCCISSCEILDFSNITPILNIRNLINSLTIQTVYETLARTETPVNTKIRDIEARFDRNLQILNNRKKDKLTLDQFILSIEKTSLLSIFYSAMLDSDYRIFSEYLDSYFLLFPHEDINKNNDYSMNLKLLLKG